MDNHTLELVALGAGALINLGVLVGTQRALAKRLEALEAVMAVHASLSGHPADHATLGAVSDRQERDGDSMVRLEGKVDRLTDAIQRIAADVAQLVGAERARAE